MFTGIIDHCGTITTIDALTNARRFWIAHQFSDLVLGESIAVDGICLTVTAIKDQLFSCDISQETEQVTTAKGLQINQAVNLERALQLSSRIGGHLVSGHVDETAYLHHSEAQGEFIEMHFAGISEKGQRYLFQKGSIAINGVSLTINSVDTAGFRVMLIPHTLERTNLNSLTPGGKVNLEFDMVAKMLVEHYQKYATTYLTPALHTPS